MPRARTDRGKLWGNGFRRTQSALRLRSQVACATSRPACGREGGRRTSESGPPSKRSRLRPFQEEASKTAADTFLTASAKIPRHDKQPTGRGSEQRRRERDSEWNFAQQQFREERWSERKRGGQEPNQRRHHSQNFSQKPKARETRALLGSRSEEALETNRQDETPRSGDESGSTAAEQV